MSEHRCETCVHWREEVGRWGCHRCGVQEHATGPLDRCAEYEPAVPFTDDVTGSDAELDALVRGE